MCQLIDVRLYNLIREICYHIKVSETNHDYTVAICQSKLLLIYLFIPLFRNTYFSVSFSTSRKITFKLYTLDKKDIIKQLRYTNLFRPVSTRCHLQGVPIYIANLEYSSFVILG